MKKTRTANLHHLYHEPLPENLKLTPKVEVDNVHQRQTTDVYEHALTITAWRCFSRAWSGRTRSGLAFRRRAVSRDLSVRNVWEARKSPPALVALNLN